MATAHVIPRLRRIPHQRVRTSHPRQHESDLHCYAASSIERLYSPLKADTGLLPNLLFSISPVVRNHLLESWLPTKSRRATS